MNTKFIILLFGLLTWQAQAQTTHTISGYIEDSETGERLIMANLIDLKSLDGCNTNNYGFYSLTLPAGKVDLMASYVGYQGKTTPFLLDRDTVIVFKLIPSSILEEVTVVAEKTKKIQKETQMSQVNVPVEQIEKIPALLGEVDVLKVLQLLPGVQSGGEGQSGMYVRGGSPDQNLVLLDGVPIYNVSHLMGFFSVFNSDAIKNVTLTKGGFPARYGGRLSSVLEINMKEGNSKKFHGEGSIGLISSRLTLEGPLQKEKTSFMISARRTYLDVIGTPLIRKFSRDEGFETNVRLYFYDLNAKINHKINDKHRVYLSAYSGADVFKLKIKEKYNQTTYKESQGIDWGNLITAARWNYKITNKLFANTTLTYSRFQFNIRASEEETGPDPYKFSARYFSGIYDWGGKIDFDFVPSPRHYLRFGLGDTYHTYNPGAINVEGDDDEEFNLEQGKAFSHELDAYAEDDIQWGALKANVGVHLSGFLVGKTKYFYPQPRLGLRYLLNNRWSLKGSFATMAQYINLVTGESLNLPTDLWVPSTSSVKPQTSWQGAIGAAATFHKDYEFSVEAYYKEMKNVVSYKEGASFIELEKSWEDRITQGNGNAYGVELLAQKKFGKLSGWVGYTLSWNNRQFDDINSGKEFPFKYDRRHDISIVASYQIKKRISVSGTWVYGTGNSISLPIARYGRRLDYGSYGSYIREVTILGDKNSFRMGAYHRLDLGVEFTKQKRWGERAWVFSVYNAYSHSNPFYVYLSEGYYDEPSFQQVALFPLIPSFSYRFKF